MKWNQHCFCSPKYKHDGFSLNWLTLITVKITYRHIHAQWFKVCVCVCVRACVRACVRVRVCMLKSKLYCINQNEPLVQVWCKKKKKKFKSEKCVYSYALIRYPFYIVRKWILFPATLVISFFSFAILVRTSLCFLNRKLLWDHWFMHSW